MNECNHECFSKKENILKNNQVYSNDIYDFGSRKVPLLNSRLSIEDYIGSIRVRLGIKRQNYKLDDGLYAIGKPNNNSPTFVTANYKLTVDHLRKELSGIDAWILILNTNGINVWCAAGKKVMSTELLINTMNREKLSEIIIHKNIILPQLCATGIESYKIKKLTGFNAMFGPVRAKDIKKYIKNNYYKTDEMKKVSFTLKERLILTPIEIVNAIKPTFIFISIIIIILFLIYGKLVFYNITAFLILVFTSLFAGLILTPIILPYIPTKSFAGKGAIVGMVLGILITIIQQYNMLYSFSFILISTSISSFFGLNFTGSTPFTCQTGTIREVKISIPIIISFFCFGIIMYLISFKGIML